MAAVEAGSGRLHPSQTKPWRTVKKGYTPFQEGDVIFAKITPCMENGKFALATGLAGGRAAGSTEFHVLRPPIGLNAKLLLFFLLRDSLRREARLCMKGAAGQLRVPPEFLAALQFPLPPLSEQCRIVAEIEKQFTRLEAAVAALKRLQANLKRYRASVLKAACEGRLVPTEAELARAEGRDYEPADKLLARILKERRARWEAERLAKMQHASAPPKDHKWTVKYKEPEAPDASSLPELPEGWAYASMGQLTGQITSGSRDWSKFYGRGTGIFIMAQNVRPARLDLSYRQLVDAPLDDASTTRSEIKRGDLLVTIVGANAGDVCPVNVDLPEHYVCQSVALMRPLLPEMSPFLNVYLNSPEHGQRQYRRFIYGAGRPHLRFDQLQVTVISLPPLDEQGRIVAEVERRISVIDELEATVEANLKRAAGLRQSILKRAFEGKLVPQDPTDEPASVLLERIRAERAARQVSERRPLKRAGKRRKTVAGETGRLFQ